MSTPSFVAYFLTCTRIGTSKQRAGTQFPEESRMARPDWPRIETLAEVMKASKRGKLWIPGSETCTGGYVTTVSLAIG